MAELIEKKRENAWELRKRVENGRTLVNEISFGIDVQFRSPSESFCLGCMCRTCYLKLHEAASKPVEKGEDLPKVMRNG